MGKRRELAGKRALVTGASGGGGRAIAEQLAASGASVLLAARSEDALRTIEAALNSSGSRAFVCRADITSHDDRARMIAAAQQCLGGLDLLINNAGVGASGPFAESSEAVLRQVMELNLFALTETTRLALPLLREGERPMIVNISSILGRRAIPECSEYCASKFAVTGFSEALRMELVRDGIDVLVVHAGLTATAFRDHMVTRVPRRRWQKHRAMSADAVARKTLKAIRRGRAELDLTIEGRLLLWVNKFLPRLLDWSMARY